MRGDWLLSPGSRLRRSNPRGAGAGAVLLLALALVCGGSFLAQAEVAPSPHSLVSRDATWGHDVILAKNSSGGSSSSMGFKKAPLSSSRPPAASPPPAYRSQEVRPQPSSPNVSPSSPNVSPSAPNASPSAPNASPNSSMGFTKPALPGSAPSQPPSAGPSVAKSGAALPPSGSPLDQAATRQSSKAALDRYETEKHQSKYQPSPWDHEAAARDPVYARANSRYRSADDYYAQRDRDLSHLNYRTPQNIFIYNNMRPNYGFWDGLFLSMLLTHAMEPGYSDWAYAHRQDPAYQQWHQDALTLAEQNGELKAQVAALDNKVSEMQAKGVAPQSADQLPPGVSEAVAVAPTAVVAGQRSLAEGERAPNTALVVSQPVAEKEPSRTWIYLGVGAVLVAGFFWLRRRA